jgi:hypothetical protein
MAARLGHILCWFFCAVAGGWVTLTAACLTSHTISPYQGFFGIGLAAVFWLIGCALRYVLAGVDGLFYVDVLSKLNRDS